MDRTIARAAAATLRSYVSPRKSVARAAAEARALLTPTERAEADALVKRSLADVVFGASVLKAAR